MSRTPGLRLARRPAFAPLSLVLAAAGVCYVVAPPPAARAASVITVTNTNDSGAGSLRQAIASAASGDSINFDTAGVFATPQTITLTSGGLVVSCAGFFAPVDSLPTPNVATAGSAIPVKFTLGGYQGLNIFAPGYPASSQIACDANTPGDEIEQTVNAGGGSLSYDPTADRYGYVRKTEKAWKGTCRLLVVRLSDGTDHFARFRFT